MDTNKTFSEIDLSQEMWLDFNISDEYQFDLESMIEIFIKIIDKLNLTYNYEYAIFDKSYWERVG